MKRNTQYFVHSREATPPPPAPLKMDYVFFHHCFIILFQFLDIIFTLKVKKNVKSGLGQKPLPPIVD